MLGAGHLPSVIAFMGLVLVDGFCKEKGVKEAENVVKRLQEGDVLFLIEKAVGVHLDKERTILTNGSEGHRQEKELVRTILISSSGNWSILFSVFSRCSLGILQFVPYH
ncbi:hypothetical protein MUK42_14542 [Musa troglodytarum]|uniref:Uncharacterized protein n=1 Tax=Musa troglodytarum TaxID=320322 RepID=A0A9E7GKX2_9LILI|nr:hypothetical protein MUK42_14542 [Musa troglodytarum]